MGRFLDLSGQRYGKLTVIERDLGAGNPVRFLCRCDCGNTKSIQSVVLRRGDARSCGTCKPTPEEVGSGGVSRP